MAKTGRSWGYPTSSSFATRFYKKIEKQVVIKTGKSLEHPQVAVGGLVFNKNRVLLVKRANPPAKGLWALPGGKVQLGETMTQALKREILEETGIDVEIKGIIYAFDSITYNSTNTLIFHYIIIDLLAIPIDLNTQPTPGDDALDARWVDTNLLATLPVSKPTLKLIEDYLANNLTILPDKKL